MAPGKTLEPESCIYVFWGSLEEAHAFCQVSLWTPNSLPVFLPPKDPSERNQHVGSLVAEGQKQLQDPSLKKQKLWWC